MDQSHPGGKFRKELGHFKLWGKCVSVCLYVCARVQNEGGVVLRNWDEGPWLIENTTKKNVKVNNTSLHNIT